MVLLKTSSFLTTVCPSDYLAFLKEPVCSKLSFVSLFVLHHLDLLPVTQFISESVDVNSLVEVSHEEYSVSLLIGETGIDTRGR